MGPRWLLLLSLVLASCSGSSNDDNDDGSSGLDLSGRTFFSESLVGRDLLPNTEIRLTFAARELTAFAGCSDLTPDGAPCSDPALDGFSQLFLSVLDGSGVGFDIEGTELTLERAGKALYFTAAE